MGHSMSGGTNKYNFGLQWCRFLSKSAHSFVYGCNLLENTFFSEKSHGLLITANQSIAV